MHIEAGRRPNYDKGDNLQNTKLLSTPEARAFAGFLKQGGHCIRHKSFQNDLESEWCSWNDRQHLSILGRASVGPIQVRALSDAEGRVQLR